MIIFLIIFDNHIEPVLTMKTFSLKKKILFFGRSLLSTGETITGKTRNPQLQMEFYSARLAAEK